MWNVPKWWAPHSGVWQALITEVTIWTSRRITVIVLLESEERGGPRGINHSLSSLSDDPIVHRAITISPRGPWVVCMLHIHNPRISVNFVNFLFSFSQNLVI